MTSLPVDSFQHVEDFGNILLQAQKDLERVRTRLYSLPLDQKTAARPPSLPSGGRSDDDVFNSLKDVLARTETSLKSKAETVLRSVEDSRIQTLPSIHPHSAHSYKRPDRPEASFSNSGTLSRSGSERQLRKATAQRQFVRRPVLDRMQEARSLQFMSNPEHSAARQFLLEKYALPEKSRPDIEGTRPIAKYNNKNMKDGHIPKGIALSDSKARVLPKIYRQNPKAFPSLTPADTGEGVYSLQNRGLIPHFADVGAAFHAEPAPMSQMPSQMHQHHEQFERLQIAGGNDNGFNLANLKLDLASTVLADDEPTFPASQQRLQAPPQQLQQVPFVTVKQQLMQFPEDDSMPMEPQDFPELDTPKEEEPQGVLMLTHEPPGGIRDYDELLDTYSLHQFLIRKGKTLTTTPEFISFQRKYSFMWGAIKGIVVLLEEFLTKYNIAIAYINGQKVVELAEHDGRVPTVTQLLECLENVDRDALRMRVPGERYNRPGGQTLAAEKIQATWKMTLAKRRFYSIKHNSTKALLIQRSWKKFLLLQNTREQIAEIWQAKLSKWQDKMATFKRDWNRICTKKRVVVHIPSLSLQPFQRKAMHNFAIRENSQLTRLCEALDPNVDIIYVCPFEINSDVHQYYLKLLEVGGIENAEDRLKIFTPENATKFPEHFSLAKLSFYSTRLLKKIKDQIRGRPAYIVPCEVGPEDLQLAVKLDLPMLAPEPDVASMFGSKSGSKRIFAAAEVPMPIGAHGIFDESDFYLYFAKLIVDQLECQRWCIKLDHESGGRGTAYFDPGSLKVIQNVRSEKANHSVRWRMPEILSAAQARIEKALRDNLPKKAILACPSLYDNSWKNFEKAFYRIGGVIEACPAFVLSSPSANVFIEPNGTVTVTDSHDQLLSSPFVYCGATFPSSAPCDLVHNYATQIGRTCYKEGIIGHIGIDFVMWFDNESDKQRLWAVDLNLRMTQTHSSFKLFHFLMKGQYDNTTRAHVDHDTGLLDARIRYLIPPEEMQGAAMHTLRKEHCVDRFYSVVNYIYQPNLSSVQFGSFFNACRLKGVSFDLRAKSGTAFMMMDSLASGTLGLLSVGQSVGESLGALVGGLSFLQEQVGLLKLSDHVYADESNLVDVLNVSKAMLKVATAP